MVWAEMVMGRFGYRPIWLWAEMTSDRAFIPDLFNFNVCYESGSFRPWVVSAWVVSANFWGGSFRPK